jgi:hypothetical protein
MNARFYKLTFMFLMLSISFSPVPTIAGLKIEQNIEFDIAEIKAEKNAAEYKIKEIRKKYLDSESQLNDLKSIYGSTKVSIDKFINYSIIIIDSDDTSIRIDKLDKLKQDALKAVGEFNKTASHLLDKRGGSNNLVRLALIEGFDGIIKYLVDNYRSYKRKKILIKELNMARWKQFNEI